VAVIPNRDPVPKGTLRSILAKSGVSVEELESVL
jgi:hypothetical protein